MKKEKPLKMKWSEKLPKEEIEMINEIRWFELHPEESHDSYDERCK